MNALGCALAAIAITGSGTGGAGAAAARPAFSHEEWVALVRLYARGERAEAVAGLGAWNERDLARQVAGIEEAARRDERCPHCSNPLDGVPLRAAVMLHWDRDHAEHPSPLPGEVEQPRHCPGFTAALAGRLARVLLRTGDGSGFARRFFGMVVLQCQWDACFADAERWASDAVLSFPRDPGLLVSRGSVREEAATIGFPCPMPASFALAMALTPEAEAACRERLEKARQDFADALAVDPGLELAQVRLGRVLWRLGQTEPARQQLEAALRSVRKVDHIYLAHLFLGRVHQDAGRLSEATREYRLAADLHPSALSAATAVSSALLLAGDLDGARQALRRGLKEAGRRSERDPLWDYLVLNAADIADLVEAVHRESVE